MSTGKQPEWNNHGATNELLAYLMNSFHIRLAEHDVHDMTYEFVNELFQPMNSAAELAMEIMDEETKNEIKYINRKMFLFRDNFSRMTPSEKMNAIRLHYDYVIDYGRLVRAALERQNFLFGRTVNAIENTPENIRKAAAGNSRKNIKEDEEEK